MPFRGARRTLIAVFAAAALAAGSPAQTPMLTFTGPAGSAFGFGVAGGADLNGDGTRDIAISAPNDQANAGQVWIYSGLDGSLIHVETGAAVGDGLGYSMAILGDSSGDGIADMVIGAPTGNAPGGGRPGYFRTLLGSAFTHADVYGPPLPPQANAFSRTGFATSVAAAGLVDADGLADAIVARPGQCTLHYYDVFCSTIMIPGFSYAGDATVFAGGGGATLHLVPGANGDPYPTDVAGMGDVDGDGRGDFAVFSRGVPMASACFLMTSCPQFVSRLEVRSGATGGVIWGFNAAVATEGVIARLGDLNGDGKSELCWRAFNGTHAYTAVLSGANGSYLTSLYEQIANIPFYGSLRPICCGDVGDVDGDLVSDYAIGESASVPFAAQLERVRVFSGATHALIHLINGPASSGFGCSVAGVGDLNGDGAADFIVGSVFQNKATIFSGAVAPLASSMALPAGCGVGGPAPSLLCTAPILGQTATVTLTGAPSPSSGWLVASTVPTGPTIVLGGPNLTTPCTALLDPATAVLFAFIVPSTSGSWGIGVPVPGTPTLQGAQFAIQAAIYPASGGLAISNAVSLTLGW
jgi:glycosylphosphatidylinositol phospholipase D